MTNLSNLQKKIDEAKKAGKVVFVFCMYGPTAPEREHHDDRCCRVFAFAPDDADGISKAMRIQGGT